MLNVWVLIPTALKELVWERLAKWRMQGYKIGILTDGLESRSAEVQLAAHKGCEMVINCSSYPNVWKSWNMLAKAAVGWGADVCVLVGDDMDPDPLKNAQEIATEYLARFPDGNGVMQPCGDPQGLDSSGLTAAARICGSPWVGRRWINESYGGAGPVCGSYNAFYADEELKLKAEAAGKLLMRSDLTQYHHHWSWGHVPRQDYHVRNNKKWDDDKALFEKRKSEGFN